MRLAQNAHERLIICVSDDPKRLIVVGDRVLIAPEEGEERTNVGLYLPGLGHRRTPGAGRAHRRDRARHADGRAGQHG